MWNMLSVQVWMQNSVYLRMAHWKRSWKAVSFWLHQIASLISRQELPRVNMWKKLERHVFWVLTDKDKGFIKTCAFKCPVKKPNKGVMLWNIAWIKCSKLVLVIYRSHLVFLLPKHLVDWTCNSILSLQTELNKPVFYFTVQVNDKTVHRATVQSYFHNLSH